MICSLSVVDVYVATIPKQIDFTPLYPVERQQEIDTVKNEKTKRQKWCSWKLLEYAMERSFGIKMSECSFLKSDNGKWGSDAFEFSLSHCDGAVAVAVAKKSIGVDIEKKRSFKYEKLFDKILNENEKAVYLKKDECERQDFLLEKWTAKESLFKCGGGKTFLPREHDTLGGNVFTKRLTLDTDDYVLSVATDTPKDIRVYSDLDVFKK
ncbi:MAG: 4'-phosphopantetheinyl transferase superfamily protein [Clostridia bacterium]|nr:4'-phosphopantetheinyl transferase superfamily protein [Clostridia bacterium]